MKFGTIASGSSGNCLYAGSGETHILIDAGVSCKRICEGLASFKVSGKDIQGLLVTHEHSDHISGIGVLSRKFHIPIYGTEATLYEISRSKSMGKVDDGLFHPISPGEPFNIGELYIDAFSISHDAVDPVSYVLSEGAVKLGLVTDLGYYDEAVVEHLKNSSMLYVEANHDINMLQVGPYPYYLKQRILGSKGHLCNEMAGKLVNELVHDGLSHVVLGHLSRENNYPALALQAVQMECEGSQADFTVAPRDHAGPLIQLS